MSATINAYALIGIPVDSDIFYLPPVKKKAFPHDYPETMKFDPQTGKKLWVEEEEVRPEYDDVQEKFGGFKVVKDAGDGCWLAAVFVQDGQYRDGSPFIRLPSPEKLEMMKEALRKLLEPLGAWDEKKFGLYAVQYISC